MGNNEDARSKSVRQYLDKLGCFTKFVFHPLFYQAMYRIAFDISLFALFFLSSTSDTCSR